MDGLMTKNCIRWRLESVESLALEILTQGNIVPIEIVASFVEQMNVIQDSIDTWSLIDGNN